MKKIITTKGRLSTDEWYNAITNKMDVYNIYCQKDLKDKNNRDKTFWKTYIYDPEYYMERGLEYFDQLLQKKVKEEFILLPLRVPGCTIGHIALDEHFVVQHIRFYENECYGKENCERRYTNHLKLSDFEQFIGQQIVLKNDK